jgi:sulfite exporter TauE/SafE
MVAFGAVAVAALAGAPHCLGMCGPFACAAGDKPTELLPYHLGRIGTYAALGALSGALGHIIPGPPWLGAVVAGALLVWFSLVLAGFAPELHLSLPGLGRLGARAAAGRGPGSRLVLGIVNGLLPCGLTWATLSVAVAAADPARGAMLMAVFGVFTTPALLAAGWGLRRLVQRSPTTRRALALVVLVSGLWSLTVRTGVAAQLRGEPVSEDVPPCHATP